MNEREIQDGPWMWQHKDAFWRINQGLERGSAASAKLVYVALTWIASDEQSETFSKPINYIADLASLGRRTVEKRLADLERLGFVLIERKKLEGTKGNDLNTYTLAKLMRKGLAQLMRKPCASEEPLHLRSSLRNQRTIRIEEEGKEHPPPLAPEGLSSLIDSEQIEKRAKKDDKPRPVTIPSNLPTDEEADKWLAQEKERGADWTTAEMKKALLSLRAGGGRWGKHPIIDWQSCLSLRMQAQREDAEAKLKQTRPDHSKGRSKSESSNLPTDEEAAQWLSQARENGADYTAAEMKSALLSLRANGGMWGKNPIVDWRSGLERQIQFDRRTGGTKGPVVPARPDHSKGF